jgi:hypothetical protein
VQFETDSISKVFPSSRHATYEAPSSFNEVSFADKSKTCGLESPRIKLFNAMYCFSVADSKFNFELYQFNTDSGK